MYNLVVTAEDGVWKQKPAVYRYPRERFLECTPVHLHRFKMLRSDTIAELCAVPALFAYETHLDSAARIGRITDIIQDHRFVAFSFEIDYQAPTISREDLLEMQIALGVTTPFELQRTHWMLKDVDLLRVSQKIPSTVQRREESLARRFETHLAALKRDNLLATWHEGLVKPGEDWDHLTRQWLEQSQMILLLISSDFLASDHCYNVHVARAVERHRAGRVRVIPILLRSCDWRTDAIRHLQPLPRNQQPVTAWSDQDSAFLDITSSLRQELEITNRKTGAEPAARDEGRGSLGVRSLHENLAELSVIRANVRLRSERHDYELHVALRNLGSEPLVEYHVDLEMPALVVENPSQFSQYVQYVASRSNSRTAFFRAVSGTLGPLFPGDTCIVLKIPYHMDNDLHWGRSRGQWLHEIPYRLGDEPVRVTLYRPGSSPVIMENPFSSFDNF